MSVTVTTDRYVIGKRLMGRDLVGPALVNGTEITGSSVEEVGQKFAYSGTRYAVSGSLANAKAMADAFWADPYAIMSDQAPDEPMEWLVVREIVTETKTATTRITETKYVRDF